jgi:hypothetical protein
MSDITAGAPIRITYVTRIGPVLTDATSVTVNILRPDGTSEAPFTLAGAQVIRDSVGTYHYDYLPSQAGHYSVYWISTGTAAGTLAYIFDVDPMFDVGLATLAGAKDYLNMSGATSVNDNELADFLAAASEIVVKMTGITGGVQTYICEAGPIVVLPNASVAAVTGITNGSITIPPTAYTLSTPAGIITFLPAAMLDLASPLSITFTTGPVPEPVRLATLDMTADLWRSQRGVSAMSRFTSGGTGILSDEMGGPSPRWKTLLAPYLRTAGIA